MKSIEMRNQIRDRVSFLFSLSVCFSSVVVIVVVVVIIVVVVIGTKDLIGKLS